MSNYIDIVKCFLSFIWIPIPSVISAIFAGAGVSLIAIAIINRLRDEQTLDPVMSTVIKATLESWHMIRKVMKVDHPLEDEIIKKNKNSIDGNGKLKFKKENQKCQIKLYGVMLPFQEFELSWNEKE